MTKNLKKFKYVAHTPEHDKKSGILLAENKSSLEKLLKENDLSLESCKEIKDTDGFFSFGKVPLSELTTFCHEFAILINAGIPIVTALETLKNQSYSKQLKNALDCIHTDVCAGTLLSDAFAKHNKIFSEMFVSMLFVAETGGSLDKALNDLADYHERTYKLQQKARNSMIYPYTLLALTFIVLIILVVAIIPIFEATFEKLDVTLPDITKSIISLSNLIKNNYVYIIAFVIAFIIIARLLRKNKRVEFFCDYLKANFPIISNVTSSITTATFARCLGVLVANGVEIIKALEITEKAINNNYYKSKYNAACDDIKKGFSLSDAFTRNKVFPKTLTQMISTGEKSGSLDTILYKSADFFDEKTLSALTKMTTLIEPLMIILIGIIVAVIIFAVFAPLLSLMTAFGG